MERQLTKQDIIAYVFGATELILCPECAELMDEKYKIVTEDFCVYYRNVENTFCPYCGKKFVEELKED
jgi:hypothetical protein